MASERSLKLLLEYRDKSYVMTSMYQRAFEFFSLLNSITNIPIIIFNSVMAILNSMNENKEEMRYANIILNSITSMSIALIANFKIQEKSNIFRQAEIKMRGICHKIEDELNNNRETITGEEISKYIFEYDKLLEDYGNHSIPGHIKKKCTELYKDKRHLPSMLNCVSDFGLKIDLSVHP